MNKHFLFLILAIASVVTPNAHAANPQKFCPGNIKNVCGVKDGQQKTYPNSCFAELDGATVIKSGKCKKNSTW
jgi:hypothetical protein